MTAVFSQLYFGEPGWLWTLVLVPALAGLFLWAERHGERRLARLIAVPRLRAQLTTAASVGRRRWRFALLLGGLAGLALAMAGPQWGYEMRETHRRGLDLVVIVDVSKSMLATDLVPDRLSREKLSVQDLVGHLEGDRLGLVAFAGSAFLQAPLTVSYDAVLDAAAELDTDLIPLGGTNIGGAIDLALQAFGKVEAGNRAIVLLSDGEPTSDTEQADGLKAAARAATAGVKLFTVGYGSPDGSLIPLDRNGRDFVRDRDGKIVRTRLNENGLRDLATAGGGFYVRFTSEDTTMRAVVERGLSQLKAGEIDARTQRRPIERYQWPLGAGLILLGLAAFVGERRKVRTVVGTRNAVRETATTTAALLACLAVGAWAAPTPPAPDANALELYRQGHYGDAYRAFADMAKKNPEMGSLQFNAGASAYMGGQYDEALDAFGHALASDNPDLQAKSHYNFGNALYRRGEEQKDREAKIKDWKNALQHYDSTLDMLKRGGKSDPLAGDTSFNRELVQKRLDEAMKEPPQQQQQKNDQKDQKDQKKQDQQQQQNQDQKDQQKQDKKDQQKQDQKQPQNQDQKDQQKQDEKDQQKQDQKDQQNPSQDQQKSDQQDQKQPGQQDQQQKQDQKDQSAKGQDQSQQQDKPPSSGQPPTPSPAPSGSPGDDQPRQRGDFQSQPGQSPTPSPGGSPSPTPAPDDSKEESGKMSEAQARALLDSLKGEDKRVMLNGPDDNRKKQDEPVIKDW